jgi:2-succinyl-5-enolpyruvyl-6-hydroxy-3-cyclohexene-1-carboxylate synthase
MFGTPVFSVELVNSGLILLGKASASAACPPGTPAGQLAGGWAAGAPPDPLLAQEAAYNAVAVAAYDLLLEHPDPGLAPAQVLRLGTLPACRRLARWLRGALVSSLPGTSP